MLDAPDFSAYFNHARQALKRLGHRVVSAGKARIGLSDPAPIARGQVRIERRVAGGEWEALYEDKNLVVTQAEALMAAMAVGAANSALNYIELGDPSPATAPALADTTLEQTTGVRKAVALSTNVGTVTAITTFLTSEGNGFTFTEAGLFTGPFAAGSMFARKTGFSVAKTAAFELKFTWLITFQVAIGTDAGCTNIALVGPGTISEDYIYTAAGGETEIVVPIDFTVAAKNLDVFENGVRKVYTDEYIEASAGPIKKITLTGASPAIAGSKWYFVHRRIT